MKCVILAGGLGSRLSEETTRIPKPMVQIGERPILWHIMKIYGHWGITDFVVCLGYKGYVIKEYFANYRLHTSDVTFDLATGDMQIVANTTEPWRVTLVDTGQESMTGGRLRRVMPHLAGEEAFCMTYGDGVGNVDLRALVDFHRAHGRQATVTAVTPPPRFGQLGIEEARVATFHEKPHSDGGSINGGFFVLSPKVADLLEGDDTIWEQAPMRRLAESGELMAFRHEGFWQPMDTLRDATELQALWASGRAPWKVWA
jgi:glucose-1-phosphate cytidylyltransferase